MGGIYNNSGNTLNTTLYNNMGGIVNLGKVINCISFENGSYDIFDQWIVQCSCFREADGTNENINENPLFENIEGNISGWDFHLQEESPCIDAGVDDESYYDGCAPPGMHTLVNDMGAYGGPFNCEWDFSMAKQNMIDFLLGRKELSPFYYCFTPFADKNKDETIDIADIVHLILLDSDSTP